MTQSRQIAWPAYLVSIALIAIPLVDTFTSLYPFHIGDARWRFGAVGLVSNALLLPVAGMLVAYVTAITLDQRLVRRVIGFAGYASAALCLAALILFGLDALQTRAAVRPERVASFNVAAITAALKTLLAGSTFLAFGVSALRGGFSPKKKRSDSEEILWSSETRAQTPSKRSS